MSIDKNTITRVAELAKIDIPESEIPKLTDELNNILSLIDTMSYVDTDNIHPMAHPFDVSQLMRKDEVTETNQQSELQKNAPATEAGLYLVPQVIEEQ